MSISPLAIVIADRGRRRRAPRPTCIIVHQTGAGLAKRAREAGIDPEAFAVAHYSGAEAYPNYLVAADGSIYALADDEERTAHAAWTPEELRVYEDVRWRRYIWCDGYAALSDEPRGYPWWGLRWSVCPLRAGRGPFGGDLWGTVACRSPVDIIAASGGTTPNASGIGIEVVHHRPMSVAAYTALARLCLDLGLRHRIPLGDGGDLPSPFLLGHADLSPLRRTARGRPYDPDLVLSWPRLQAAIGRERDLTRWRTWT